MAKTATKKTTAKKSTKKTAAKASKSAKKAPTKRAAAKKATKKATAKKPAEPVAAEATENDAELVVEIDRRENTDRRDPNAQVAVKPERRKVARRRQIDPTTCERDYSGDEIEFMQAMDAYKRSSGRMFPTCSEILEVVRALGYSRPGDELNVESTDPQNVDANETDEDSDDFAASIAGADSDFDIE